VAACSEAYADELASDNGTRNDQAAHDEPVIPLIFYTANVPAEEAKTDGYGGEAEAALATSIGMVLSCVEVVH